MNNKKIDRNDKFYSNFYIKVKKPKKIKPSQIKIDKATLQYIRELNKKHKTTNKTSYIKYLIKVNLKYNIYFYKIIDSVKELTNIKDITSIKTIDTLKIKPTRSIFNKYYFK